MQGVGLRVKGAGFRVHGEGFRVSTSDNTRQHAKTSGVKQVGRVPSRRAFRGHPGSSDSGSWRAPGPGFGVQGSVFMVSLLLFFITLEPRVE